MRINSRICIFISAHWILIVIKLSTIPSRHDCVHYICVTVTKCVDQNANMISLFYSITYRLCSRLIRGYAFDDNCVRCCSAIIAMVRIRKCFFFFKYFCSTLFWPLPSRREFACLWCGYNYISRFPGSHGDQLEFSYKYANSSRWFICETEIYNIKLSILFFILFNNASYITT